MKHPRPPPPFRSERSASTDPSRPSEPRAHAAARGPASSERALLLETRCCTIHWDEARALVWFARTALPYRTTAEIGRDGMLVHRALEKTGRGRLLVDLRAVAVHGDSAFDVSFAMFRRKLFRGGDRMAILVGTAIGLLQAQRQMREGGFLVEVFSDEREALAFFSAPP